MRTLRLLCFSVLTLSLFGCATAAPVVETRPARATLVGAESVRVAKDDAPAEYVEVGPVEVVHGDGCGAMGKKGTYEGAYALLKQKAVSKSADYVQIMSMRQPSATDRCWVNEFAIVATLYRSPELAVRAAAQAEQDAKPRCVAQERPEWHGANAATKKALLDQCRPLAAMQAP